uniref:Uncharacterized protein n=1 Tax=Rangifer tarandus platyrhynchus TaxID=3082113 RepID=A0ACB0DXW4_RANTA|nr:unnamed protein product [Rangifer tarandus platyrhynchus]
MGSPQPASTPPGSCSPPPLGRAGRRERGPRGPREVGARAPARAPGSCPAGREGRVAARSRPRRGPGPPRGSRQPSLKVFMDPNGRLETPRLSRRPHAPVGRLSGPAPSPGPLPAHASGGAHWPGPLRPDCVPAPGTGGASGSDPITPIPSRSLDASLRVVLTV